MRPLTQLSIASFSILLLSACQPPTPEQQNSASSTTDTQQASPTDVLNRSNSVVNKQWEYIEVDNQKQMWGDFDDPEWLRYVGLAAGDINNDGLMDIVSGRHVYLQQQNADEKPTDWKRLDLGANVDAILVLDVDGDETPDIIAQALPNLYWYEIENEEQGSFIQHEIGQVPASVNVNSQGFTLANIVGDERDEFIIAGNGNLYAFKVSATEDGKVQWTEHLIAANTSDDGIGVGDIDGDGDMDIAAGRRLGNDEEAKEVLWFKNPGHMDRQWQEHFVGRGNHAIDRVEIADLDGNGKGDVIVTEERYPGFDPDAQMVLFIQKDSYRWNKRVIVTQHSMNNLDVGDVDQDGDIDIVTAEHKGDTLKTELWLNNGRAVFTSSLIDTGKESHLGTQLVDIDNDGDLDLISAGWDRHQYIHIWLNPLKLN